MPSLASLNAFRLRRAFSLVEMLVVIAVIGVLAAVILPRYIGGRTKDGKAASPMARARGTECIANIRSVRQGIEAARIGEAEEKFPASLTELKLPSSVLNCAEGKVAYVYDPQTGVVRCPFTGHESH
jgi:prepilin-type N-terminal cleavage/methylation domain-containing protein